jgi:hypothetical protein
VVKRIAMAKRGRERVYVVSSSPDFFLKPDAQLVGGSSQPPTRHA